MLQTHKLKTATKFLPKLQRNHFTIGSMLERKYDVSEIPRKAAAFIFTEPVASKNLVKMTDSNIIIIITVIIIITITKQSYWRAILMKIVQNII